MTTSINDSRDASLRGGACALLGLAADASPDECRRVALAQIDAADYEPTAAWHAAAEVLFSPSADPDGDPRPVPPVALCEEMETQLRDQIEGFAATMFQLEPAVRLRRWIELRKAAAFSRPLHRRLELLSPGLELDPPAVETLGADRQSQLIRWSLALFPLRPAARSIAYMQALEAMREAPREWESAANKLARSQPRLAQLAPDLLAAAGSHRLLQHALKRRAKNRARAARKEERARRREGAGAAPIWVVLAVIGIGARLVGTLSKMDSPASNSRPGLSAKDIQSAQEMFERMQREREAWNRQSKGIVPGDLQRESGSPFDLDSPEVRQGMEALRVIQELRHRREAKKNGDPAAVEEPEPPTADPSATESGESDGPRQPESNEAAPPRDGERP